MNFDSYIETERRKNDLQEKNTKFNCDCCDGEIYEGNEYFVLEGYNLCESCFDEKLKNEKKQCRQIAGNENWEG